MLIKPLHQLPIETIHEAFVEAFSDYSVPMDLPLERFKEMMRLRDLEPEYSLGAFDDDRLVSFIICGFRTQKGEGICYDGGTGTLPDYRRKGLGNRLLSELIPFLKERGVARFVLEVMTDNTPAIDLYQKHGFESMRRMACVECQKTDLAPTSISSYTVTDDPAHFVGLDPAPFMTFEPSWQNEKVSVMNGLSAFSYVALWDNSVPVAYGLIHKTRGDMPQLGVLESHAGKGLELQLLNELKKRTSSERMYALNVEEKGYMLEQMQAAGFTTFVTQFEMKKTID